MKTFVRKKIDLSRAEKARRRMLSIPAARLCVRKRQHATALVAQKPRGTAVAPKGAESSPSHFPPKGEAPPSTPFYIDLSREGKGTQAHAVDSCRKALRQKAAACNCSRCSKATRHSGSP